MFNGNLSSRCQITNVNKFCIIMVKTILTSVLLILGISAISAQEKIVVISSICRKAATSTSMSSLQKKLASYSADCKSDGRQVRPGDEYLVTGCINIPEDCVVKLLYGGRTQTLDKQGLHQLETLFNVSTNTVKLGFTDRFLQFISKSMQDTENEKKVVESHRRNMEVRAGIRGAGAAEHDIETDLLTEGNVSSEHLTFYWGEDEEAEEYIFRLYSNQDKVDLFMKKLTVSEFTLNKGQVNFQPGKDYTWQVKSAANPRKQSVPRTFVYNPQGASDVLTTLKSSKDYTDASEVEQSLMHAYSLEEKQYNYDAAQVYEEAMRHWPDNRLVQRTAAAFYARMNKLDTATSLVR